MKPLALIGARIFDSHNWYEDHALLLRDRRIEGIVPFSGIPLEYEQRVAGGSIIAPGFIDLQVNGGGGIMFDGAAGVDGIETICRAHARFGTTALLPTLITDTPEASRAAMEAGMEAARKKVAGFCGLHLEGPHLSIARKGAHDPSLIRPMEADDLERLVALRRELPALLLTLAPENVSLEQVRQLVAAGIVVSLGHTDAACATALQYVEAGATMVTHLFNAMSPLQHREPGVVGAALESGKLWAGIIADGIHVDPVAMRAALRAKAGPARIFVVTDAMSPIGTELGSFTLNGRTIQRRDGRLTLKDGTLAGADIDMAASVAKLHRSVGLALDEALRMASLYPAQAMGLAGAKGALAPGMDADLVVLNDNLDAVSTWICGRLFTLTS